LNNTREVLLDEFLRTAQRREMTLAEMQSWGEALGRALPAGCVVTLDGDLGTGKTTLARAICRGLGVLDVTAVTSPTFAIIQEYPTKDAVVTHADLYRLERDSELDSLGWDEIVESAHALIVEWPERSARPWPVGRVQISLAHSSAGFDTRVVTVTRG
jgi:tRNA threonylcarbamoyladenosine biosynthesis protein TsaE